MGDLTIRCTNCEGLAKDIDASRPFWVCKFCGAQNKNPLYESRAEQQARRKGEMAAVTQAAMAGIPKFRWWWVAMPVGVMTIGSLISVLMMARQQSKVRRVTRHAQRRAAAARVPPKPTLNLTFDSRTPLIHDANGDGVEDVALLIHEEVRLRGKVQRDERFLACYSGKGFEPLWKTKTKKDDRLWLAPGLLLVARAQHLLAYAAKDGRALWRASLSDKIDNIGMVEGQLRVWSKDKRWTGVDAKSGKLVGKVKEPHFVLPCDYHYRQNTRDSYCGDIRRRYRRFPGYTVHAVYCPPTKRTRFRPSGRKLVWHHHGSFCHTPYGLAEVGPRKGTRVPSFLGYARKSKRKLWQRKLTDELESMSSGPKVALDARSALAFYHVRKQPEILELFNLADGKVLWTRPQKRGKRSIYGLALGPERAYVLHAWTDGVEVIERQSGTTVGWIRGKR